MIFDMPKSACSMPVHRILVQNQHVRCLCIGFLSKTIFVHEKVTVCDACRAPFHTICAFWTKIRCTGVEHADFGPTSDAQASNMLILACVFVKREPKRDQKRSQERPRVLLGPLWHHFRVVWGSIGDPFGLSWDPLGPSWDPFRPSLVYLEGLLGVSWHSLGVFWSTE